MKEITRENVLDIINSIQGLNVTLDQCDDNMFEKGLDSIKFIQVIVLFEKKFNCKAPYECLMFDEMNTVNKMTYVFNSLLAKNHDIFNH